MPPAPLTPADRRLLARHVTSLDAPIYCIRALPPEVTAVLFAYVSRSPASFRDNLLALLRSGDLDAGDLAAATPPDAAEGDAGALAAARERARAFHEKWVVGYGHASVAEHADLKYAIEGISIHAAKVLEDNRLGSYTEKSTRYQVIGRDDFVVPAEVEAEPALRATFEAACRGLFDAYAAVQEPLERLLAGRHPPREGASERAWRASLKAKVCDVARYLLPAATRTSLGASFNARSAAHAITKCCSHPLAELRAIGDALLAEGRKVCPALLKYAGPSAYLAGSRDAVAGVVGELLAGEPGAAPSGAEEGYVHLADDEPEAIRRVCAALIYEASELPWAAAWERAGRLGEAGEERLLDALFGGMGRHDWPRRACEHAVFQADMLVDYGAFRDIQRHRMATLTEQATTTRHGYDVPPEIDEIGAGGAYRAAMDRAAAAFEAIHAAAPAAAPLVVAQGFRKRVFFTWNLRELEHFIRLRSGRAGHVAYRRVAQRLHVLLAARHPRLARRLRCDHDDAVLGRLEAEERAERRREAAAAAAAPPRA